MIQSMQGRTDGKMIRRCKWQHAALATGLICLVGGCATGSDYPDAEVRAACADASTDPDVRTVVMRDQSRTVEGAAAAGVAKGAVEGAGTFAGTAGIAIATNRGGAGAFKSTQPDVALISCDDVEN